VHFVDEEYDTGPILAQRCVQVFPTDSPKQLAARVLEQVGAGRVVRPSLTFAKQVALCSK
jgi:folate-dependent phosphoribosylglycinamide formyltransferase PurN